MTMTDKLWIGWLYGNEEDRDYFHSLGVKGPMVFDATDNSRCNTVAARKKAGIFGHCWADDATMKRLWAEYPAFFESFSLVEGEELKRYLAGHADA
jgi:hypothetical protein